MSRLDTTDDERMAEVDTDTADIKHTRSVPMDASIRADFGLSMHEYNCLLKALQSRLGVDNIEEGDYRRPRRYMWQRRYFYPINTYINNHIPCIKHAPRASHADGTPTCVARELG